MIEGRAPVRLPLKVPQQGILQNHIACIWPKKLTARVSESRALQTYRRLPQQLVVSPLSVRGLAWYVAPAVHQTVETAGMRL